MEPTLSHGEKNPLDQCTYTAWKLAKKRINAFCRVYYDSRRLFTQGQQAYDNC